MAPSVVLEVRPSGNLHVLDQLDSGGVELALSTLTDGGDRSNVSASWKTNTWLFSPTAIHWRLRRTVIEKFAALPHITITSSGDDTHFIDDALADHGLTRFVSAKVPLHSLILMLVEFRGDCGGAATGCGRSRCHMPPGYAPAAVSFAARRAFDDLAPSARQ